MPQDFPSHINTWVVDIRKCSIIFWHFFSGLYPINFRKVCWNWMSWLWIYLIQNICSKMFIKIISLLSDTFCKNFIFLPKKYENFLIFDICYIVYLLRFIEPHGLGYEIFNFYHTGIFKVGSLQEIREWPARNETCSLNHTWVDKMKLACHECTSRESTNGDCVWINF